MTIRTAQPDDLRLVMTVLDGANLAMDVETVRRRLRRGRVLVAVEGTIVGTLVTVPRDRGAHIEAIAVRRRRRGQGLGTDLVRAAAERWGRLTARFDPAVRGFYRSVGFDISQSGDRLCGVRVPESTPDISHDDPTPGERVWRAGTWIPAEWGLRRGLRADRGTPTRSRSD
ncbi:MAG: GNAT family N-acetyltransferase [Halodesulfurarchaeum sp.]